MRQVTVQWQGQVLQGEELEWESDDPEPWRTVRCADGTVLKIKAVLTKVVRLPVRNEFGEPIYLVWTLNAVTAHVSAALMVQERSL